MVRHTGGLAASPQVRYMLEVAVIGIRSLPFVLHRFAGACTGRRTWFSCWARAAYAVLGLGTRTRSTSAKTSEASTHPAPTQSATW